jgi:hypothetical protein
LSLRELQSRASTDGNLQDWVGFSGAAGRDENECGSGDKAALDSDNHLA